MHAEYMQLPELIRFMNVNDTAQTVMVTVLH